MRKLLLLLLIPVYSLAQNGKQYQTPGAIHIPEKGSLKIHMSQAPCFNLDNFDAYAQGSILPTQIKLVVKCNRPWKLLVSAKSKFFSQASGDKESMPCDIIRIKSSSDPEYTTLSETPQILLQSQNTAVQNVYHLDLELKPTLNYEEDMYNLGLNFSLQPK
jgi:hypothetical protein